MALTNCPMCESSIPAEDAETSRTCAGCGADLSRWMGKSQAPKAMPSGIDPLEQETRRPARNGLYCVAAVWAIPAILITAAMALSAPRDSLNLTFGTIPIVLCVMSVIAALKFGAGRKSGRLWAFLPVWVLMFCFPIGTIVAYMAHSRLRDANLN